MEPGMVKELLERASLGWISNEHFLDKVLGCVRNGKREANFFSDEVFEFFEAHSPLNFFGVQKKRIVAK